MTLIPPDAFRPRPIPLVVTATLLAAALGASADGLDAAGGSVEWTARYNGAGNGFDWARAIAVSPDGARVYVTGTVRVTPTTTNYGTIAYDAATGATAWRAFYQGPVGGDDAYDVAVSSDGASVFVTGQSIGSGAGRDFATVAYDAASGSRLWAARYATSQNEQARAVGVAPDGSRVFVTGSGDGTGTGEDFVTVAYDAATGSQAWFARYNEASNWRDYGESLAVSPDGARVFVSGGGYGGSSVQEDYLTIAYDAASGNRLWRARYNGGSSLDYTYDTTVSPDGARVVVTGVSYAATTDWATVAYAATSGAQQWVTRFNGPGSGSDAANAVAFTPDGANLFVGGGSTGSGTSWDFAVMSLDPATGGTRWQHRYNGPANGGDIVRGLAVSGDGTLVVAAGESAGGGDDYATIALDAATGDRKWSSRYNGPAGGADFAEAIALAPDGARAFVAGYSEGSGTGRDFATIAYATGIVVNKPPVPAIDPDPLPCVVERRNLALSAARSHDPDGAITAVAWDFGDGTTAAGVNVTKAWSAPGTFAVTLAVTDDKGAVARLVRDACVVPVRHGVAVAPREQAATIGLLEEARYRVNVTNTGNVDDDVDLAVAGPGAGWSAALVRDGAALSSVALAPNATATIEVRVKPDATTLPGSAWTNVTATSRGDPRESATGATRTTLDATHVPTSALPATPTAPAADPWRAPEACALAPGLLAVLPTPICAEAAGLARLVQPLLDYAEGTLLPYIERFVVAPR